MLASTEVARRASRGPARRALEAFGIALLTLACFEIGLRGLDLLGWLPFPSPASASRGSEFWDPTHSDFGVWHAASSFARHQTNCFDVTYRTTTSPHVPYGVRIALQCKDEIGTREVQCDAGGVWDSTVNIALVSVIQPAPLMCEVDVHEPVLFKWSDLSAGQPEADPYPVGNP